MNVIVAVTFVAGIGLLGWGGLGVLAIMEGDTAGAMANRFAEVSDWMIKSGFGAVLGLVGGYFTGKMSGK